MTSQAANGSLPDATTQLEKPCVPCCAYCYVTITTLTAMGEKLDKCGKCQKRKFCSRDCQVLDWKAGHKHFCGISGEANVDWEVKECGGGKGFGIFALRDIGKDEKIIVERPVLGPSWCIYLEINRRYGSYSIDTHKGRVSLSVRRAIRNLYSASPNDMEEKLKVNQFCHEDSDTSLSVQLSRVNHACYANSTQRYSKNRNVRILVASRSIKAGREITFSYKPEEDPEETRQHVIDHYGFQCQCEACVDECLGDELEALFTMKKDALMHLRQKSPELALQNLKACLLVYDKHGNSTWYYHWVYWFMFLAERAQNGNSAKSQVYIQKAYEAALTYTSDKEDERVLELKGFVK